MAKRIFELAKELKVESKAIVAKCHAEGIPEATVKNHMSTISVGLEATIREWFSQTGGAHTAVETSDKVDLDQARSRHPRKARSHDEHADGQGGHEHGGESATAVVEGSGAAATTTGGVAAGTGTAGTGVTGASTAGAGTAGAGVAGARATARPTDLRAKPMDEHARATPIAPRPTAPVTPTRPGGPTVRGPIVSPAGGPGAGPTTGPGAGPGAANITGPRTISPAASGVGASRPGATVVTPAAKGPEGTTAAGGEGGGTSTAGVGASGVGASAGGAGRTATTGSGQVSSMAAALSSRPVGGPTAQSAMAAAAAAAEAAAGLAAGVAAGLAAGAKPTAGAAVESPIGAGSADGSLTGAGGGTESGGATAVGRAGGERGVERGADHGPGEAGAGGGPRVGGSPVGGPARGPMTLPSKPAPMNVPTRPTVVAPVGPKLATPAAVRLSGPKVVRVEAPEPVSAPRPRRFGPGAPGGAGGAGGGPGYGGPSSRAGGGVVSPGGAPGSGGGGGDDDRGRSPRRKDAKRSSGAGVPDRRRGRSGAEWAPVPTGTFSEQDLIEREERLARAGGFLKKRKQDLKKPGAGQAAGPAEGRVRVAAPFTIKDLSEATGVKGSDIVKKLFLEGVMKKINDYIEPEKAVEIMMEFDIDLDVTAARTAEETVSDAFVNREVKDLRPRGPIVTILGHVDHGKTSLLDKIRNANVAAGEAGGITQKTSAFRAEVEVAGEKKSVVFLDTPGHEAFTSMRSRGAKLTDVVVLVVSAPEGVMPQTIESISHAKAAGVPIVVALNKIDRPDATENQVQKTLGELAKAGLNPSLWGGDTEVIKTSATTGQGITELLETLDYQAQLKELRADFAGPAQGTVVESKVEEGRGATANILVQQGALKVGDFIVAGRGFGRVRDITDDRGVRIKEATPPMPVQISGLDEIPDAGDKFYVVDSLRKAQEAAEQRRSRERQVQLAQPKVTLDSLFSQMGDEEVKEIRVILKTDQQGTVDVLKTQCEKIKTSEVKVRVIDAAVGGITESNVILAEASKAIIVGFNVIPSGKARQLAEQKGVEVRTYQVIYDITDDLKKAAEGLLAPELREEILGHAEVRAVFKISKVGAVAGCYVTDGTVQRDALIRVTRNGIVIENDRKLAQLKRMKDDAKDVRMGMECGMKIDGYDDIKEGDVLECYKKTEVKRTL